MVITGIMACDPLGVIGVDNKLPWNCREEMDYFHQVTDRNIVIMGHNTFLSMPKKSLDKYDCNIVFSRKSYKADSNIIFVSSLTEAISLLKEKKGKKFMIGGRQIAEMFLQKNLIEQFLLTKFKRFYQGDVFFPLNFLDKWRYKIIKENNDFTIYQYFNPNPA
jgi:dihydrofolate reductase